MSRATSLTCGQGLCPSSCWPSWQAWWLFSYNVSGKQSSSQSPDEASHPLNQAGKWCRRGGKWKRMKALDRSPLIRRSDWVISVNVEDNKGVLISLQEKDSFNLTAKT